MVSLQDTRSYAKDKEELLAVEWVDKNYIVRWIEPLEGNKSAHSFTRPVPLVI